ncbi:MAG: LysM peptidoglycan-binding domain-containing protein [Bacteroidia bacterium]|nr:LysM peptidoglycan-binding domain-containing protein [Bacteroidia bacterium]
MDNEKNSTQHDDYYKKSWLEEQIQKRNKLNEDSLSVFRFKDETTSDNQENQVQNTATLSHEEHKNRKQWLDKLHRISQVKVIGEITLLKAAPYVLVGIFILFLLVNIRFLIFDEGEVPSLHNVNVKDTLLSDIPITKTLDPNRPEQNNSPKPKKQKVVSSESDESKDKSSKTKDPNQVLNQRIYYRVKPGDKFNDIARKHGLTPAELKELNPNIRPERIQPGQKLRVKKLD